MTPWRLANCRWKTLGAEARYRTPHARLPRAKASACVVAAAVAGSRHVRLDVQTMQWPEAWLWQILLRPSPLVARCAAAAQCLFRLLLRLRLRLLPVQRAKLLGERREALA